MVDKAKLNIEHIYENGDFNAGARTTVLEPATYKMAWLRGKSFFYSTNWLDKLYSMHATCEKF